MKTHFITTATAIAFLVATVPLAQSRAQNTPPIVNTDAKAISLVRTALKLVNSSSLKTARIHAEGKWLWTNQGLNPQESTRTLRLSADWKVDFENHRFLERDAGYLDKNLIWCSEVMAAREMRYTLFCHSNVFDKEGPTQTNETWSYRMDTTYPDPQWHLAHALQQSQSLRWEGERVVGGRSEDVLSYTDEFHRRHWLFLNSRTHLVQEVSNEARMTRFGDGFVPRIVFADYRRIGQLWSPLKVTIVQNSFVMMINELQSIRRNFDHPFTAADFAPSATAHEVDQKLFEFHVSEVAQSVYFVENASPDYNCLFVVFADYVLVVEAPSSDNASTKVMNAIHDIAPGKPIKYIVPTHFHEDHIGGLRAYMREGATVVTTPGNLQFIEVFSKKLKLTNPQMNLPVPEAIAGQRRFTDGMTTVDLLSLPSPHVDEMVVPFISSAGIVYVADGFTRDWGPWRPVTAEERTLATEFKKRGLNIRMVLPGHGPAPSQTDLERYWRSIDEPIGSIRTDR